MSQVVTHDTAGSVSSGSVSSGSVSSSTTSSGAQRGLVTVEFIFGIILVIAIITVVVSVIHNPAIGSLLVQLVSWILGLIKGVKA
ncbi:hypothetical protein GCM10011575_44500 [Microlunatus endophyticus]|uniref:Uncharacterized protein n=1 Tax=Microlunatus endophyticus TaxID=1716077 RepID=A0A917W7X5_9ACTN|nr:hypothetical protein [Microlunatus endophyticus]GGL81300.1 hypothetical protein GCM10011575_44500 [Microlunatus endophyticus]